MSEQPQQVQAGPRGPHVSAVVWGLLLLGVAVLVAGAQVGVDVDLGLLVPAGLVAVGVLLVLSALVALVRGRSRAEGQDEPL